MIISEKKYTLKDLLKSKDDVLTLLVHLGYLAYDADTKSVRIPNEEVRAEFIRAVTADRGHEQERQLKSSF